MRGLQPSVAVALFVAWLGAGGVSGAAEPAAAGPADRTVILFIIDGLRPDVLMEMAEGGQTPTIRRVFIDGGTWLPNAFTTLPSETHVSLAALLTGTFSDTNGQKLMVYYDRQSGRFMHGLDALAFPLVAGRIRNRGVKAMYDYFPDRFGAGALPMQFRTPAVLQANLTEWFHRGVNTANYASHIVATFDEVQARFALDLVAQPEVQVMVIWFGSVDHESHTRRGGQFGEAREAIVRVDACIARVIRQVEARGRLANTCFILCSDHGHGNGGVYPQKRFDVERELFHGQLGLGAWSDWHVAPCPGAPRDRMGAIGDADGVIGIYLPRGSADSKDLSTPNPFEALIDYPLPDGRRIDTVELFAERNAQGRWPEGDYRARPVDFALVQVDAHTALIHRSRESQALIRWRAGSNGVEFAYEPVRHFPAAPEPLAHGDPLGYLGNPAMRLPEDAGWLAEYHSGREWLRVTVDTEYPGCVDSLGRFFRYESRTGATTSIPDILLFANRGWVFQPEFGVPEPIGTYHGMASREVTRICLFFAGPGIRRGQVLTDAHWNVDVLPTVMEMRGMDWRGLGLDGEPIAHLREEPAP